MFRFLPEQASEVAEKVDFINNLITDISVFFTVAIVGAMIYFAVKYRQRGGVHHETPHIEGNFALEVVWTVVPTIICIFIAAYGLSTFKEIRTAPSDALTINATARQWAWDFQYSNGKTTAKELVVPVNTNIKIVLATQDVTHGFFVPAMRVKSDVVPGRFTYVSFKPIKTGEYEVFCSHYCGMSHSGMMVNLKVVPEAEYLRWLNDDSDKIRLANTKPSDIGKALYTEQGCNACHSLDGSKVVGPSFLKIYGRKATFDNGQSYEADENYIKESILIPQAHVVDGYPKPSPMPSFQGRLNDEQIKDIIEFMKTLDGTQEVAKPIKLVKANLSPVEHGKALFSEKACVGCHSLDGSKMTGPTFKGIYGTKVKVAEGGATKDVDINDEYIKSSILAPNSQIVDGFQPNMMPPNFRDLLTDQDIADITEFIKSLK